VPDAAQRTTMTPWWAPRFIWRTDRAGRRYAAETHPDFPYREWGRLCTREIYVEAYGANVPESPDGASTRMLAWARDRGQYPALGITAARVLPAHQTYRRSLNDQIATLLHEPVVCLWDHGGIDRAARLALRVVAALRARSYTGDGAVLAFQRAANIVADGIVGPLTVAALGLPFSPGVRIGRP
jgi:hypothetical protein